MAGFSYAANTTLVRSNIWSQQLKDILLPELFAMKYVRMLTDFPDGNTINIPSIGQAETNDYVEGQAVKYSAMDEGNFTFSIDQYKQSGTYITEQMKQDSFYTAQLVAAFVPKQHRAIMTAIEAKILSVGPAGQTPSNSNAINGANHRYIAGGPSQTVTPRDFSLARYALTKANVPNTALVAVVDPSVAFAIETLTNLVNVQNNPQWEGIVSTGMTTGLRFVKNIYGFDVWESQFLPNTGAETINGVSVNSTGVANQFFSFAPDVVPIVGLLRQPPKVDSEYNKDLQREEYVTTCRYGFKLYRSENMVVCLSATDQVL